MVAIGVMLAIILVNGLLKPMFNKVDQALEKKMRVLTRDSDRLHRFRLGGN